MSARAVEKSADEGLDPDRRREARERQRTPVLLPQHVETTRTLQKRDPPAGLAAASKAVELSKGKDPLILHTLGWAQSHNDQFGRAVETLQKALDLLEPDSPQRAPFERALARFRTAARDRNPRP